MHALLKWGNEIAAQKMDDRQNSSSHAGEKKGICKSTDFYLRSSGTALVMLSKIRTTVISFLVKITGWAGQEDPFSWNVCGQSYTIRRFCKLGRVLISFEASRICCHGVRGTNSWCPQGEGYVPEPSINASITKRQRNGNFRKENPWRMVVA